MEIYRVLTEYFKQFQLEQVIDSKLKYLDCYYVDKAGQKLLIACKLFSKMSELEANWERYQDFDLALYLQKDKYAGSDLRWDMYYLLIYSGNEELSLSLTSQIERDKFCARKIVVDGVHESNFFESLNLKLPFTSGFYRVKDLHRVVTNQNFFERLNKVVGLNGTVMTNEVYEQLKNRTKKSKESFLCTLLMADRGRECE